MLHLVVSKELDLSVIKSSGNVSLNDVAHVIKSSLSDPDWHPEQKSFVDLRDIGFTVPYVQFDLVSELLKSSKSVTQTKCAILTGSGLNRTFAQFWVSHSKKCETNTKVFTEFTSAARWLDVDQSMLNSELSTITTG